MYKDRWYYSTWFIMILAMFSILIVPAILAVVLLIIQLKNRREIRKNLIKLNIQDHLEMQNRLNNKQEEFKKLYKKVDESNTTKNKLEKQINEKQHQLTVIEQELQSKITVQKEKDKHSNKIKSLTKKLDQKIKDYKKERHYYLQEKKIFDENKSEYQKLKDQIHKLLDRVVILEEEALLQSFGFYEPKYKLETSAHYKEELAIIRKQQREMVKNQRATTQLPNFTFNGSTKKGQAFLNESAKMAIRAFNVECENAISKVTLSNIHSSEKRIHKSAESIKKTNKLCDIQISPEYINLKIEELYLAFEYEQKKEAEREEQRLIREQMREEARAKKEIEAEKAKIEKEERHFNIKISKLRERLKKEKETNQEKEELIKQINTLNKQLEAVKKDKENVSFREQNTRAGYVYIISNIGSFGEGIYKIGVTRRLEPFDRVKELGSASVPFNFDVHAMIFSNDAPKLEKQLHDAFLPYSVNKINTRKEFFKVSLDQIEKFVNMHHDKTVIFTKIAEAAEYRQSLALEESNEQSVS
ncbi:MULTISPECIES: DUF4041 domain-containing protein [Shouchella]|uniref:DUF4041 domain-containing protein n=1 Tax=Shouchella TaxID=2893057 RepID=UPI001C5319F6|nr:MULTISPECIES: DUF4041 domain-containing protein [Shouchella]MCM3381902.1 DUF4041 domain-containing protein [Shouchella rhizosphaerae]